MDCDTLFWLRMNARDDLEDYLAALRAGNVGNGTPYPEVSLRYRLLGIATLLADMDVDTYAQCLIRSAQADLALRHQANRMNTFDPYYLRATQGSPFACALAAGAVDLARDLATLMPTRLLINQEYEDDYLCWRCQHLVVLEADAAELDAILTRWDSALQGEPCAWHSVCAAIVRRDQAALDLGLTELVIRLEREATDYAKRLDAQPEIRATDDQVSVRGLAILRLAQMRGLTVLDDYPFMPREARVATGSMAYGRDEWRTLDRMGAPV